jgi:hypothetical protein
MWLDVVDAVCTLLCPLHARKRLGLMFDACGYCLMLVGVVVDCVKVLVLTACLVWLKLQYYEAVLLLFGDSLLSAHP